MGCMICDMPMPMVVIEFPIVLMLKCMVPHLQPSFQNLLAVNPTYKND